MIIKKRKKEILEEPISQKEEKIIKDEEVIEEFDFEKIEIKEREERRRGNRRRGYRRIDDRNLVSRAQEESIAIREEAAKDGYKQGIANAQQELQYLKESIEEFFSYKERVFDIVSKDILSIAIEISKKIIKKETEEDKEILINLIKEILSTTIKNENKITLKVAPKDADYVKENLENVTNILQNEAKFYVIADEAIEDGGVLIETANGIVDATFKTQVNILVDTLLKT